MSVVGPVAAVRVGPAAFLVHGEPGAAEAMAERILRVQEAGSGIVVVASAGDPGDIARAVGTAVASVARAGCAAVRLVMPGAGARGAGPSIGERLAAVYGIAVVAPDGPVAITAGGMLFVHGAMRPDGGERSGQWVTRGPGGAVRRAGPRHPAPVWQEELLDVADLPQARVVQIPAGVLLAAAGTRFPYGLEAALAIPCVPEEITVLAVNGDARQTAEFLRVLPAELAQRVRISGAAPMAEPEAESPPAARNEAIPAKTLIQPAVRFSTFPAAPLVPGVPCQDAHRDRFMSMFGSRYNVHLRAVAAAMAQVPALRSADEPTARTELAAVRAHLDERTPGRDAAALDSALRAAAEGEVSPDALAYGFCFAAGLRRLPAYLGAVYLRAEISPPMLEAYTVGRVLIEPASVGASLFPDALREGGYLIWSVTGRRTALLTGGAADRLGEVRFLPGSGFHVVAVDTSRGSAAPVVVLYEQAATPDKAALDKLLGLADARRAADPEASAQPGSESARATATATAAQPKVSTHTQSSIHTVFPMHAAFPIGLREVKA